MSIKKETVQQPVILEYIECNNCHIRISEEEMEGALDIGQFRKCNQGNLSALLSGAITNNEMREEALSHGKPHIHASESQHLCVKCAQEFTAFVGNNRFQTFMTEIKEIMADACFPSDFRIQLSDTISKFEELKPSQPATDPLKALLKHLITTKPATELKSS